MCHWSRRLCPNSFSIFRFSNSVHSSLSLSLSLTDSRLRYLCCCCACLFPLPQKLSRSLHVACVFFCLHTHTRALVVVWLRTFFAFGELLRSRLSASCKKRRKSFFPAKRGERERGKLTVEIVQCCCVLHRYWLYVHIAFIYSSTRAAVRETVGSDEKSGCIYFVVTSSKWYDVKFVKLRSCCWWGEEFSRACECACRAVMVGKSEWKRGKLLEESMK